MPDRLLSYIKTPDWDKQHHWRRAVWQGMNRLGLTGLHVLPTHESWIDLVRLDMPLPGLDPQLNGFRLVQGSDLHYSPVVSRRYLSQFVAYINRLKPDLVAVTGDLVTGGYRYNRNVAGLLAKVQSRLGTVVTFGNHDYSIHGKNVHGEGRQRARHLQKALEMHGMRVLRNEAMQVRLGDHRPMTLVGLDDEWSGHLDARRAWEGADPRTPIVCLNHNPKNVRDLLGYPWQWMLSGHTHGRAIATSKLGKMLWSSKYREYVAGHYRVEGRDLYVNRGLSYGQRANKACRPEITLFTLRPTS